MSRARVIETIEDARDLPLDSIEPRREPNAVLMCEPTYFEVKDSKNPHMNGNIGAVDRDQAMQQWQSLKSTFENLGCPVKTIPGQPGAEDMVFAANQVLPVLNHEGHPYVLLAEMVHPSRRREVPYFARWFEEQGYGLYRLGEGDHAPHFEGQGDAIWHPGRRLLWSGHGHRTEQRAHQLISDQLDVPVISLRLLTPHFYHLDTAFCPLNEHTLMFYPEAFDDNGRQLIDHYFPEQIKVSEAEALNFACNAVVIGKNVVLQKGSRETCNQLRQHGFTPIEVDTSEFMKSGGSVFCMKMMIY